MYCYYYYYYYYYYYCIYLSNTNYVGRTSDPNVRGSSSVGKPRQSYMVGFVTAGAPPLSQHGSLEGILHYYFTTAVP